jgi:hypothetical protein
MNAPHRIHVRIGRLVVDGAALGGLSPAQFALQLQHELGARLGATGATPPPGGLAQRVGAAVRHRVDEPLAAPVAAPTRSGRDGR